ncbi:MAG: PEP-CTERM sorting domain-containing protein [Acidobacteriota bacterium]
MRNTVGKAPIRRRPIPPRLFFGLAVLSLGMGPTQPLLAQTVVTFDAGAEGWNGPQGAGGATTIETSGGNPGAHLRTVFNDFGITFDNSTNPDFVFDYTQQPTLTLGLDLKVDAITFSGMPVPRPWLLELRDLDAPPPGFPWVSVWFKFADVSQATHGDWTTLTVTLADTSVRELPAGWGGFGAEDALGNPMLPDDRTFADVLAGIDEVAYTTLEPGFVFGFTDFDVRLDNLSIDAGGLIFADGFESGNTSNW